jgi:hypothetical protein
VFSDDHLDASLPFGIESRVCIGKPLAFLEMRLLASHLLWNFDMILEKDVFTKKNQVWGLDGQMKPMKVFHSMAEPPLWVLTENFQQYYRIIISFTDSREISINEIKYYRTRQSFNLTPNPNNFINIFPVQNNLYNQPLSSTSVVHQTRQKIQQ